MHKVIIFVIGLGVIFGAGMFYKQSKIQKIAQIREKVYVTNLVSNDVSVIDTATDEVVATIPVGKGPNGISYWVK